MEIGISKLFLVWVVLKVSININAADVNEKMFNNDIQHFPYQ